MDGSGSQYQTCSIDLCHAERQRSTRAKMSRKPTSQETFQCSETLVQVRGLDHFSSKMFTVMMRINNYVGLVLWCVFYKRYKWSPLRLWLVSCIPMSGVDNLRESTLPRIYTSGFGTEYASLSECVKNKVFTLTFLERCSWPWYLSLKSA